MNRKLNFIHERVLSGKTAEISQRLGLEFEFGKREQWGHFVTAVAEMLVKSQLVVAHKIAVLGECIYEVSAS